MWRPNNLQWWVIALVALFIVAAWPPAADRSLLMKFVNWAADPWDALPILPEQLAMGLGDDPQAVEAHDMQVQQYDALYNTGGWTRKRLELKVATDPFNPSTERQLLVGLGVLTALVVWRWGGRKTP
jgi:hypothetical protein